MNAPASIDPIQRLAAQIVTGDMSGLPRVDFQLYTNEDWEREAQCALDTNDYDELNLCIQQEIANDYFCRQGEAFDDSWRGFGNWWNAVASKQAWVAA